MFTYSSKNKDFWDLLIKSEQIIFLFLLSSLNYKSAKMQYKGVNQAYLWDFCLFWSFDNGCSETRGVISDTESS